MIASNRSILREDVSSGILFSTSWDDFSKTRH